MLGRRYKFAFVDLNQVILLPTQLLPIDSVIDLVIDLVTYPVLTRLPTPCFHYHPPLPFSFLFPTPFLYIYIEALRATFNRQSSYSYL